MKNLFKEPYIEILKLSVIDVIATSGTEDPVTDDGENNGEVWEQS